MNFSLLFLSISEHDVVFSYIPKKSQQKNMFFCSKELFHMSKVFKVLGEPKNRSRHSFSKKTWLKTQSSGGQRATIYLKGGSKFLPNVAMSLPCFVGPKPFGVAVAEKTRGEQRMVRGWDWTEGWTFNQRHVRKSS